ncbi:MAG: hypothetical protein U5K75_04370 [Ahrensia sp.]|nr:hypothetical protein [Ahrensia sp.]
MRLRRANPSSRQELKASASYNFDRHWSVFGSATYDIENSFLDNYQVGVGYVCDCFNVRASYTEDREPNQAIQRKYQLFISLRTLGDFGVKSDEFANQ